MTVTILCLLAGTWVLRAGTAQFTLGGDPNQVYNGVNVGPYSGTLTGTNVTEFLCLDKDLASVWNTTYDGSTSGPVGQAEDEAAFLASYLLYLGAPSSNASFVNQYEGPITFAIWQIMGTLGGASPDPAAAAFITMAQNAYNANLITSTFLSHVLVFTPNDQTVQRFITAFRDEVPEPASIILLSSGLLLLASRRWSPKRSR